MSITTPSGRIVNLEESKIMLGKCDWCDEIINGASITNRLGNFCSGHCVMAAEFDAEDSHNQEMLNVH